MPGSWLGRLLRWRQPQRPVYRRQRVLLPDLKSDGPADAQPPTGYDGPGSGAPTARYFGDDGVTQIVPGSVTQERDDEIGNFGIHARQGDRWYIDHAQQGAVALCYHTLALRQALQGVLLAAQQAKGWEQRAAYAQAKIMLEEGVLWPWEGRRSITEALVPKRARKCLGCTLVYPVSDRKCPSCGSPLAEDA